MDNPYAGTDNEQAWAAGFDHGLHNATDLDPEMPQLLPGEPTVFKEGALAGREAAAEAERLREENAQPHDRTWGDVLFCAGSHLNHDLRGVGNASLTVLKQAYDAWQFVVQNRNAFVYVGGLLGSGTLGAAAVVAFLGVSELAGALILELFLAVGLALLADALLSLIQCMAGAEAVYD